ncbi:MAG: hypothetical protein FWE15_18435 [Actinomycetia bacterium]|nr:hypothetical protein [Actinomycetes bacterium]MCL2731992.1 hypothetical protein [Actinomycetes bacterium]
MSTILFRSHVRPEQGDAVEAGVRKLFAAVEEAAPKGIRYTSFRHSDGDSFVVLLALDEGIEHPLTGLPEFKALQGLLKESLVEPPVMEEMTLLGDYRA